MKHTFKMTSSALGVAMLASLVACATEPAAEPLNGDLLIRDVRTIGFEGEAPAIRDHAYVLVKDGKVLAVRDTADGLSAPRFLRPSHW